MNSYNRITNANIHCGRIANPTELSFINGRLMARYRRHAVVAILVVAAIITPTTDVFTLCIVALPIWLLYEMSIWLVPKGETH